MNGPNRGKSTRSSAGKRKSAASSRSSAAGPRTIRSSSAPLASARRPSPKVWPSASLLAMCPTACWTSAFSPSIWPVLLPVPSTVVNLKNGSSASSTQSNRTTRSSSSSTKSISSSGLVPSKAPWMRPTSSNRPWPVAICSASAPRLSTNIRNTLKKMPPWPAASSPSWSANRRKTTPWLSFSACATATKPSTRPASPTKL